MALVCDPGSGLRTDILLARDALGVAIDLLRAAGPATWTGPGAAAYADAVTGLVLEALSLGHVLDAAERAAGAADAELAARWS